MCSHALRIYIVSYPGIIPYIRVCEKQSEDTLRYLKNILRRYIFFLRVLYCVLVSILTLHYCLNLLLNIFEYFFQKIFIIFFVLSVTIAAAAATATAAAAAAAR
jgi:hypothetical protein